MSFLTSWWVRATAVISATLVTVLVPAAAWAASNEMVLEAARRRSRVGGLGLLGGLCCLVVIVLVVLGMMMFMRGRRGRR